ncbi:hypothetical protein APA_4089 [Pseudanabaena sp. lw0831]|nr:hypothetical protein APA_4089 [Pseudanabaena sp. lw0831]
MAQRSTPYLSKLPEPKKNVPPTARAVRFFGIYKQQPTKFVEK